MTNPAIKLKRSDVAGKIPLPTDLLDGQVALNTKDGSIYTLQDGSVYRVNSATDIVFTSATSKFEIEAGHAVSLSNTAGLVLASTYDSSQPASVSNDSSRIFGLVTKKFSDTKFQIAFSGVVTIPVDIGWPIHQGLTYYISDTTPGRPTRKFINKNSKLLSIFTAISNTEVKINFSENGFLGESATFDGTYWSPGPGIAESVSYEKLDETYAKISQMGISFVGEPGEEFLPITADSSATSLFAPKDELPSIVTHLEPNGDLVVLAPMTNGTKISYRMSIVKEWKQKRLYAEYRNVSKEYRPSFLVDDSEYIRNIYLPSENAAICEVYKVTTPGGVTTHTFDRHVIIVFASGSIKENAVNSFNLGTSLLEKAKEIYKDSFSATSGNPNIASNSVALKALRSWMPNVIAMNPVSNDRLSAGLRIAIPLPVVINKLSADGGNQPKVCLLTGSSALDLLVYQTIIDTLVLDHETNGNILVSELPGGPPNIILGDYTDSFFAYSTDSASVKSKATAILDDPTLSVAPSIKDANPHAYRVHLHRINNTNFGMTHFMPLPVISSTPGVQGRQTTISRFFSVLVNLSSSTVALATELRMIPAGLTTVHGSDTAEVDMIATENVPTGQYIVGESGSLVKMLKTYSQANLFQSGYGQSDNYNYPINDSSFVRLVSSSDGTLDESFYWANYSTINLYPPIKEEMYSVSWLKQYSLNHGFKGTESVLSFDLNFTRPSKSAKVKKNPITALNSNQILSINNSGHVAYPAENNTPTGSVSLTSVLERFDNATTSLTLGGFNASVGALQARNTLTTNENRNKVVVSDDNPVLNLLRTIPSTYLYQENGGPGGEKNYINSHTCTFNKRFLSADNNPKVGYKSISFSAVDPVTNTVDLVASTKRIAVDGTFWDTLKGTIISEFSLSTEESNAIDIDMALMLMVKSEASTGQFPAVVLFSIRYQIPGQPISSRGIELSIDVTTTVDSLDSDLEIVTGVLESGGSMVYTDIGPGLLGYAGLKTRTNRTVAMEVKNPGSANTAIVAMASSVKGGVVLEAGRIFTRPLDTPIADSTISTCSHPSYPTIGQTTFNSIYIDLFNGSDTYRKFGFANKNSGDDIFFPFDYTLSWESAGNTTPTFSASSATIDYTKQKRVSSSGPATAFDLYVTSKFPVILGGVSKVAYKEATELDSVVLPLMNLLNTTDIEDVKNSTIKLYASLGSSGVVEIIASKTQIPESKTTTYIGSVTTDSNQIISSTISPVYRILTYRLSPTQIGSAIPVSTGDPATAGTFSW